MVFEVVEGAFSLSINKKRNVVFLVGPLVFVARPLATSERAFSESLTT